MRFLRAHTEIYSQMASGRPLISNPAFQSWRLSKPQMRNVNILKITIRIKGPGNFNHNGWQVDRGLPLTTLMEWNVQFVYNIMWYASANAKNSVFITGCLVINFKTHITYIGNRIPKEQGKRIIQKTTESKDKSKLTCQNGDIVKTSELPYL